MQDQSRETPKTQSQAAQYLLNEVVIALDLSENDYNDLPRLALMSKLRTLNISHNRLSTMKLSTENSFPDLEEIDVSYNNINDIIVGDNENAISNLLKLNISHNRLSELKDAILIEVRSLEVLDLSHNEISALSFNSFEGIKNLLYLNIAYNKLKAINNSFLRFTKLKFLYINNNELQCIKVNEFSNLNQLHEIDLSNNAITVIEKGTFVNMFNIVKINLKNNLIQYLEPRMFLSANALDYVDVSINEIQALPKFIFKGKNVTFFDVSRNQLEGALIKGIFEGLTGILELDLSHQSVTSIEDYAFVGLNMVESLLLNGNEIRNISNKSFYSLRNLKRLDISNNKIVSLNFDLDELLKLELFSIKNNFIKLIPEGYFDGLYVLLVLDLSNNNISKVSSHCFSSLNELVDFDIGKNPLTEALEDNTFLGLNSLPVLDISCTALTTIKNDSFNEMITLHTLNISHSNLNIINYNSFKNTGSITILDLSHNHLESFNINSSTLANLQMLYLHNNRITITVPDIINKLTTLHTINLSYNEIKMLNNGTFYDLKELEYLDLSNNRDMQFNSSLSVLNKLKELYLSGICKTPNFEQFLNSEITDLDISQANISNVTSLKLSNLRELKILILNNNVIEKLELGALNNLSRLETLDLSHNKLMFIQPSVFKYNSYLTALNLSHNRLTTLSFGIFLGLFALNELDVSYNQLEDLHTDTFYGIPSLRTLIIDFNKVRKISVDDFSLYLSVLSIGGNPLPCNNIVKLKNKHIISTITALKLEYSSYENIDGITCLGAGSIKLTPQSLNGTDNILSDIRNILLDISSKDAHEDKVANNHNSDTNFSTQLGSLLESLNRTIKIETQEAIREGNISNTMLISAFKETFKHAVDEIVHENNVGNSLLERILRMIVAINTTPLPVLKDNSTNGDILPYIARIKQEFDNTLTLEKEKILSEVAGKISDINKKVDGISTAKPLTEKAASQEIKHGPSSSLFTEVCVALTLVIVLCFVMFQIYKHIILPPRRTSYSTQQIADAMENSNL
ncbi:unnamed protein product [Leptosia nina]|uniref:Chaoptin n=1 Tax=Leptosia nina TaxID=320188 RepID=A0AAV1JUS1_9NEOP